MLPYVLDILHVQPGNLDPLTDEGADRGAVREKFGTAIKDVGLLLVGIIRLQIFGHVCHCFLVLVEVLFQ